MNSGFFSTWILFLDLLSLLCHSIGLYHLTILYEHHRNKQQRLLVASLSLCEALISLLFAIQEIVLLRTVGHSVIVAYLGINITVGMNFVFYGSIVFITLDKFILIVFRPVHEHHCSVYNTKCLLAILWLLAFISNIIFCSVYAHTGHYYMEIFIKYVFPSLDAFFLMVSTISYVSILTVSWRSRRRVGEEMERRSFVMVSLLVLTFLIFIVVPDVVSSVYRWKRIHMGDTEWDIMLLLYRMAMISDAVLYILLSQDIRKMICLKVGAVRGLLALLWCRNRIQNTDV